MSAPILTADERAEAERFIHALQGTGLETGITQKLARALATIAALEQDKARLDWMEATLLSHWYDLMLCWDDADGLWLQRVRKGAVAHRHILGGSERRGTVRGAIDAARQQEAPR